MRGWIRDRTNRIAAGILVTATLLHLPVSCDLIDRADLMLPDTPGVPSLPREVLQIALLPIPIGATLAVWSLRTRRGGFALAAALAVATTVGIWHAYHFEVVVPEIRAAKR